MNEARTLDDRLRGDVVAPPPPDLLGRLQAEIPEGVSLSPAARERLERELAAPPAPIALARPEGRRRAWLVAASVALVAGVVGVTLERQGVRHQPLAPDAEVMGPPAGVVGPVQPPAAGVEPVLPPPSAFSVSTQSLPPAQPLRDFGAVQGGVPQPAGAAPADGEVAAPRPVQPLEVPEPRAAAQREGERRDRSRDEESFAAGVSGGIEGGVSGGVVGGIPGGVAGAVAGGVAGGSPGGAPAASNAQKAARGVAIVNSNAPPPPAGEPTPSAPAETTIVVTGEAPVVDPLSSGGRLYRLESSPAADTGPKPVAPPPPAPQAQAAPPSTGGTAEPNGQPYGDVFFRGYGTNPFIDTEDDPVSTFALDVDTGSFNVVRRYLDDGHLPPADAVRIEELLQHFRPDDPAPSHGDFAIAAEGSPSPFGEKADAYYLLRLGIRARDVDAAHRPPADLVFAIDTSGSMADGNRLELVKDALDLLLGELRGDDRVGVVAFGSGARVVLEPTADRGAVRAAMRALHPEGSTNAEAGLALAYEMAVRAKRAGAIHRVMLLSDGVANVGTTSAQGILGRLRDAARQGIELSTVGFGMGNYNDELMEQLADAGNGRYAYVDTLAEAKKVFVDELTATLQTVAAEARAQLELDPRIVSRYRLLGFENRDVADERFRDDTLDAGEIGAGHAVTALYELKLRRAPRPSDVLGSLRLRWASVGEGKMEEARRIVSGAAFASRWESAPPALRLASLVAEWGEILKGSPWARRGSLDEVLRRAETLAAERPGDARVAELVELVRRSRDLARRDAGDRER